MSRVQLSEAIFATNPNLTVSVPASGLVTVYERGGTALASIYSAVSGGTALPNPRPVSDGYATGYIESGSYDLVASANGQTGDRVEWEALRGDSVASRGVGGLDLRHYCTTAELADDAGPGINAALADLRGTPSAGEQGGRLILPSGRIVVQTGIDYDRLSGVSIEGQGCGIPFLGTGFKAVGTVLENQTGGACITVRRSQTNSSVTRTEGVILDKFTIENQDNETDIGIDITAPQGRIKVGSVAVMYGLAGLRVGDPEATSFTQSPFDLDADWLYLNGAGPDGSTAWIADSSSETAATIGLHMRDYGFLCNFRNVTSRYWGRCFAKDVQPAVWASMVNFWGGLYEAAKKECIDARNIRQVNFFGTHAEGSSGAASGAYSDIRVGEADSTDDNTDGTAQVTANFWGVTFAGDDAEYRIQANRFGDLTVIGCADTTSTTSGYAIGPTSDGFDDAPTAAGSSTVRTIGNAFRASSGSEVDTTDYDGVWSRMGGTSNSTGLRRRDDTTILRGTATSGSSIALLGDGTLSQQTITVTGADIDDLVVGWSITRTNGANALQAGVQVSAYVSAANTVRLVMKNTTGSDITLDQPVTFRAAVLVD